MLGSTMEGGGAPQEPPHPVQGSGVALPPLPILLSVEFGSISKPTESAVRFQQLGENLGQLMQKIHAEHINQIQANWSGCVKPSKPSKPPKHYSYVVRSSS